MYPQPPKRGNFPERGEKKRKGPPKKRKGNPRGILRVPKGVIKGQKEEKGKKKGKIPKPKYPQPLIKAKEVVHPDRLEIEFF